jgi:hypothetical protein
VEDDYFSDGDEMDEDEFNDFSDADDAEGSHSQDDMQSMMYLISEEKIDSETRESAAKRPKLNESSLAPFAGFETRTQGTQANDESLGDYYLVCGSFNDLIVVDCASMETVAELSQAVHRFAGTPGILLSMQRLAMIEYIPSLSLIAVASQGACSVLLISLVLDAHTGILELRSRFQLPESAVLSPIAGLCIHGQNAEASRSNAVKMSILFHFGHMFQYSISGK